jgi:protein subunit release factor A
MMVDAAIPSELLLIVQAFEGGVDAMMAAHDLIKMYTRYAFRRGWLFACREVDAPAPSQVRSATCAVAGVDAGARLRHE